MILTDTGALVALISQNDGARARTLEAMKRLTPPMLTTDACLAEAFHLARRGGGEPAVEALRTMIETQVLILQELTPLMRADAFSFMRRYRDRPCDYADASLLAVAQQEGHERVFSLDEDFLIYRLAGGRSLTPIPGPSA